MDPFSLSTGVVGLVAVALKLVVGTLGMIDKTVAAYDEAADELNGLQQDLEQLQTQMVRVHGTLNLLASNTKDRGFKRLLKNDYSQAAVRELCTTLQATLSTLTQMTDKINEDDLRPAPLPSDKKSLEFIRAVFKHSITPSKITDLVKALREMRSDVQTCLTKLEATFQHVQTLYDMMSNGLGRITSRTSATSTSTNLSVRIKLAVWLKGWEGTWGPFKQRESTSLRGFLESQHVAVAGNSRVPDDLVAGNSHVLQSKRVTIDGITYVTDDLLGRIFYHLCELGPLSLRHLLFVSRRFYSVAVNNAHLWTTISLDSPFVYHFHERPEQGNRFVEHCLHRSGSLPLCLNIDYSDINAHDLIFLLHPLETFGKPEWRAFERCTSLMWDARIYGEDVIRRFVDLLPRSLPSLKHISLTSLRDVTVGSQFPNCPVLERVEMLNHAAPSPHFWGTNFLHLTTLSFGNDDYWDWYDLTTLSLFPGLHDLTLSTASGWASLLGVHSQAPVLFEHLHILRAHGCIPRGILTRLVAPALEELHLKANAHNITSIDALQTSFNPLCQDIYALLPNAVTAEEPEWATNLSKLVQKCTRIKSLYISGWMEGECKKFIGGRNVILHVQ